MDSGQKIDVRLVGRTSQKPSPEEQSREISFRSPAKDNIARRQSVALRARHCATTCPREAHGG